MLTATELRTELQYDPDTGVFTWLRKHHGKHLRRAGTIDSEGYIRIIIRGRYFQAHRLAWLYMTGTFPIQVDHKDLNRTNNAWSNLRAATHSQNMANKRCRASSGLKGAYKCARTAKWNAYISDNGRQKYLGRFDTKEEAHAAYATEAKKLFGEFARIS